MAVISLNHQNKSEILHKSSKVHGRVEERRGDERRREERRERGQSSERPFLFAKVTFHFFFKTEKAKRTEERRVGKECSRLRFSAWSPCPIIK